MNEDQCDGSDGSGCSGGCDLQRLNDGTSGGGHIVDGSGGEG